MCLRAVENCLRERVMLAERDVIGNPEPDHAAIERYKEALGAFADLILREKLPSESVRSNGFEMTAPGPQRSGTSARRSPVRSSDAAA